MSRVLVAHNYHMALDPHARHEGKPYPPLGTIVVATRLQAAGHDVVFYDATFHDAADDFEACFQQQVPDKVLLVADHHAVPQKMCLQTQRNAALRMIQIAKRYTPAILCSGPDVSDHPEVYLEAGAAIAIRGEVDAPALDWVEGRPSVDIDGAVSTVGQPLAEAAKPIQDLSVLPTPNWSFVNLSEYAHTWRSRHGFWEAAISSARGCPYRCNWCAKPVWGRSLQLRPVADVLDEMDTLASLGCDQIWFSDDIFGLKPQWLQQFRDSMRERGPILPYRCLSRADILARGDSVDVLAESGCVEVWMGAESGSQSVLDAMDKDQTIDDVLTSCKRLRKAGIRVGLFSPYQEVQDCNTDGLSGQRSAGGRPRP